MKLKLCYIMLCCMLLSACATQKEASAIQTTASTDIPNIVPIDLLFENKPSPPEIKVLPRTPQVVLHIGKTSTYGHSPIFFIKVLSNGEVQYTGIQDVPLLGEYRALLGEEEVKGLLLKATSSGYFELADEYPNEGKRLIDLPNTITYINNFTESKTINNNYDAPKNLMQFENYLLQFLGQLNYKRLEAVN